MAKPSRGKLIINPVASSGLSSAKPSRHSIQSKAKEGRRTTVAVPKKLRLEMKKQIVEDGYGFQQKSKWICEAIHNLLNREDWCSELLVDLSLTNNDKELVNLDAGTAKDIDEASPTAERYWPQLKKGAQSAIIRTAIITRISSV